MSSDSPTCVELRNKIPADWAAVLLDTVTDFQEGPGILAKDFYDTGIPLLRLRNIETPSVQLEACNFLDPEKVKKKWSHFALKEGDLLISTSASLGRVSVVGAEAVGSIPYTGIIRFRSSSPKLDHKFLRAFLSSAAFIQQAEQMATGSVIKHFGPSHLRQMAIALPSIAEQVHIAGIFDVLDERIRLLRETNATLEAIAQALFKSWFVDFDPVHAKAQGNAPEGMDEATAALFPDSFEESELGLVPKGWKVTKCQNIIDVRDGTHESPKPSLKGYPLITSRHITGGGINFDNTYLISEQDYESVCKRSKIHRFDVLITMIGTVGIPVIVLEDKINFAIKNIGVFKTSATPYLSYYFYLLLSSSKMQQYLEARLAGTTQKYLSLKSLREIAVLVPQGDLLAKFSIICSPIFEKIYLNSSQVKTLATLRDTLLPRLISGQLRLPETEATLEEAMA